MLLLALGEHSGRSRTFPRGVDGSGRSVVWRRASGISQSNECTLLQASHISNTQLSRLFDPLYARPHFTNISTHRQSSYRPLPQGAPPPSIQPVVCRSLVITWPLIVRCPVFRDGRGQAPVPHRCPGASCRVFNCRAKEYLPADNRARQAFQTPTRRPRGRGQQTAQLPDPRNKFPARRLSPWETARQR